jgi:hypothetical protein
MACIKAASYRLHVGKFLGPSAFCQKNMIGPSDIREPRTFIYFLIACARDDTHVARYR